MPDITDEELAMIVAERERKTLEQQQQRRGPAPRMVPQSAPRPPIQQYQPQPVQPARRQPERFEERQFAEPVRPSGLKGLFLRRPAREPDGPRRMPLLLRIVLIVTGGALTAIGAMLNGSWYAPATMFKGGLAEIMYGWSVGAVFLVIGCIVVYHAIRGN